MYIRSENCPVKESCANNGIGTVTIKELANKESMYGHGRFFAHVFIKPGCSVGDHPHIHETEFYYIVKGEGIFNDDGTKVTVRAGDLCVTGNGATHGLANESEEDLEIIALIVTE
jgi:mannose-6-phosphate isomerase-like protein (cupin superfamily)